MASNLERAKKVLDVWTEQGNFGLTLQGLCTILGIKTNKEALLLLKKLSKDHNVFGLFCKQVGAPVFSSDGYLGYGYEEDAEVIESFARFLLTEYPIPLYKSIRRYKGIKTLVGINKHSLAQMRKAIKCT
jgi:hypothetical protein